MCSDRTLGIQPTMHCGLGQSIIRCCPCLAGLSSVVIPQVCAQSAELIPSLVGKRGRFKNPDVVICQPPHLQDITLGS